MTKKKLRRKVAQVLKQICPGLRMSARLVLARELVKQDFFMWEVQNQLEERGKTNEAAQKAYEVIGMEREFCCSDHGYNFRYLIGGLDGYQIQSRAEQVPPQTPKGTTPNPCKKTKRRLPRNPSLGCWVLTVEGESLHGEDSFWNVSDVFKGEDRKKAVQAAFDCMTAHPTTLDVPFVQVKTGAEEMIWRGQRHGDQYEVKLAFRRYS